MTGSSKVNISPSRAINLSFRLFHPCNLCNRLHSSQNVSPHSKQSPNSYCRNFFLPHLITEMAWCAMTTGPFSSSSMDRTSSSYFSSTNTTAAAHSHWRGDDRKSSCESSCLLSTEPTKKKMYNTIIAATTADSYCSSGIIASSVLIATMAAIDRTSRSYNR